LLNTTEIKDALPRPFSYPCKVWTISRTTLNGKELPEVVFQELNNYNAAESLEDNLYVLLEKLSHLNE
jgi:hypothetical protein